MNVFLTIDEHIIACSTKSSLLRKFPPHEHAHSLRENPMVASSLVAFLRNLFSSRSCLVRGRRLGISYSDKEDSLSWNYGHGSTAANSFGASTGGSGIRSRSSVDSSDTDHTSLSFSTDGISSSIISVGTGSYFFFGDSWQDFISVRCTRDLCALLNSGFLNFFPQNSQIISLYTCALRICTSLCRRGSSYPHIPHLLLSSQ